MNWLHSFITGGQSDFLMPLNHKWHGIDMFVPLSFVCALCILLAVWMIGEAGLARFRKKVAWPLFVAAALFATAAYAASSTLGNLSAGSAISTTDLFYDVQTVGAGGVKVTGTQLQTFIQGNAVTSIATSCTATGGTITTTGTISTQELVNAQIGPGYTLQNSDCGKLVTLSNASPQTLTLPTGLTANIYMDVCNVGSGTWSLSAGGVLNGSTAALTTKQCIKLRTDGTDFWNITTTSASGANPTATATGSPINGSAATFMRSDAAPAVAATTINTTSCTPNTSCTVNALPHPGYVSGNWYSSPTEGVTATGSATTANVISCFPFSVGSPGVTIKFLGARITTAVSATHVGLALYNSASGRPGTLLDSAAVFTTSGTGAQSATGAVVNTTDALNPGMYWACVTNDSTNTFAGFGGTSPMAAGMIGSATLSNVAAASGLISAISCVADGTSGAGKCNMSAWSAGIFTWGTLATAQWTDVTSATAPNVLIQVN